MSLALCIKQAGNLLSPEDKAFLLTEINNGATEAEAIDRLEIKINAEMGQLLAEAESEGYEPQYFSQTDYVEKRVDIGPTHAYKMNDIERARIEKYMEEVDGFADLVPFMQDDELAIIKSKGAAEKIVQLQDDLPTPAQYAAAAKAGEAKRGWYKNSEKAIKTLFGKDAPRFAALLAALSPQVSVETNTRNAINVWVAWNKAGRPKDQATIREIMGENVQGDNGEQSILPAWYSNTLRAFNAPEGELTISGPKANSFQLNLLGYQNEVTNDAWMSHIANIHQKLYNGASINPLPGKSAGYAGQNVAIRRAAKELGWTAAEVQETVWSFAKTVTEVADNKSMKNDAVQVLKSGAVLHEHIGATVDFEQLFIEHEYAELFDGMYDKQLAKLRNNVSKRKPSKLKGSIYTGDKDLIEITKILQEYRNERERQKIEYDVRIGLSSTTDTIPGISALNEASNNGDMEATRLLQAIAFDSLNYLTQNLKTAEIEYTEAVGAWSNEVEASLGVSMKFREKERNRILLLLKKFSENFNQQQFHMRTAAIEGDIGDKYEDGSYNTRVIRFNLKKPLTQKQIISATSKSGIPGLTVTDDFVEAYFLGDTTDEASVKTWIEQTEKVRKSIGGQLESVSGTVERIWAFGDGYGATQSYDSIPGRVQAQTTDYNSATAQRVGSYLAGYSVPISIPTGPKFFPNQTETQEEIAEAYANLPINDLANPLVNRAYTELANEVLRQFDALPIKTEAWTGKGEPYRDSKGKLSSAKMRQDILFNNHLFYYKTTPDTFGPEGEDFSQHPLLGDSGRTDMNGEKLLFNDLLRIVHDYYAHSMSTTSFGKVGEEAGWLNHMYMTNNPWARWALTSETRGQNSYVNRVEMLDVPPSERPFAPQKAALLPLEYVMTGAPNIDANLSALPGSEMLNLDVNNPTDIAPADPLYPHVVVDIDEIEYVGEPHAADRAVKFMQDAIEGVGPLRRPPSARVNKKGKIEILDGRSFATAAKVIGFKRMPVRIIDIDDGRFQLPDINAQAKLDELFNLNARAKDKLDKVAEQIADEFNGSALLPVLKGRKKTVSKVISDYKGDPYMMKDIARGTIVIDRIDQAGDALNSIKEKYQSAGWKFVGKDRISLVTSDPTEVGYVDMKFNLTNDNFPGVVTEMQVNIREMIVAKDGYGHQLYDRYVEIAQAIANENRLETEEEKVLIDALTQGQAKIYGKAFELHKEKPDLSMEEIRSELETVTEQVVADLNQRFDLRMSLRNADLSYLAPLWSKDEAGKAREPSGAKATVAPSDTLRATGKPSTSAKSHSPGSSVVGSTEEKSNIGSTSSEIISDNGYLSQQEWADSQPDRGRFYPDVDGQRFIRLLETSDLSTFLHESSHLFLTMQMVWANKYGMTENQKAILDWMGVNSFEEITKEEHERWAESFEIYLREGKAPSLKLRRAFASFTRWLKLIYRSLTDARLRRGQRHYGAEIRGIFDRLLATEEEIAMAAASPEYAQLFQTQEQAGMTDAEWRVYTERAERIKDTAQMTLDEKVLKQYRKMKTKEWNAERDKLMEEEKERLKKEPVYSLVNNLVAIKDEDGNIVQENRIDFHKLEAAIGGQIGGKFVGKAVNNGQDPGLYAEDYGFSSVQDMYDKVNKAPGLTQAAKDAAQQRMVEKYGDLLHDGTLEDEVREHMLNEDHAYMLMAEMRAAQKTKGQQINRQLLKEEAQAMIDSMPIKDIRPDRYYRQMIKAAQKAAAGENVAESKMQQLANHYLYKAALDAKQKVNSYRKYIRTVQTKEYDTRNVDFRYIQQMKNLSMLYDARTNPRDRLGYATGVIDFYRGQNDPDQNEYADLINLEMMDPVLLDAMEWTMQGNNIADFKIKDYKDMTIEEIKGVTDMLRHMRYVGGQIANIDSEIMKQKISEGTEHVLDLGGKDHPLQEGVQIPFKGAKAAWSHFWNWLPSLGNLVRKLDGFKDGGWFFDNVYTPINEAMADKFRINAQMVAEAEAILGDMSRIGVSLWDKKDFQTRAGKTLSISSEEVFMMAVYWGTESSREAIMQGHELDYDEVVKLMSERLNPDQLQAVNAVWAMNETQWPRLQKAAKELLGVAPPKLAPTPFIVNGVQMTGGHMQLMYDDQKTMLQKERQTGMRTASVVPSRAGSTFTRVGSGGKPVRLLIDNITQSMEEKSHYIAFSKVGRELRTVLHNKEMRQAIIQKHGTEFFDNLINNISGITTADTPREQAKGLTTVSRWARSTATMMHLGYSIRNTVQQFGAFPIAMKEVGSANFINAATMMASGPTEFKAAINAKSEFMRNRATVVNREAREFLKKKMATTMTQEKWETFKQYAFWLQTKADSTMAYPTWYAKYQMSMAEHGNERRAISEADRSVGESIGSGSNIHLGTALQSNQSELVKTMTLFGSWFNAYYQRLYKSSQGFEKVGNPDFMAEAIVLPFIVAAITQAAIMDFPDEDEEIYEYLWKNTWQFTASTMPVIRDFVTASKGFKPSTPIGELPAAFNRIGDEFGSWLQGNQSGLKMSADIGRALGSIFKLPGSGNLWRMMDYIDAYMDNEEGDFFNVYQALTEGRDKDK